MQRGMLIVLAVVGLLAGVTTATFVGPSQGTDEQLAPSDDERKAPTPSPPTARAAEGGASLAVRSTAFEEGDQIPARHTCDGEGTSPPLTVTGLPAGTITVALLVGDPDAPYPGVGFTNVTHWVLWNADARPGGTVTFPEAGTPPGAVQGENDAGSEGWTGPCPPHPAQPHRYIFTAYAVDSWLDLEEGADREELEEALDGHVLTKATLTGLYERSYGLPP